MMDELHRRVRAHLREEIARTRPDSALLAPGVFDAAETVLRKAIADERPTVLHELMHGSIDWELQTSLRLTSHRPRSGGFILWVKRHVLLPLTRWLFNYSRDNFARQARVNDLLMSCVETLVVEHVRLRREVESLRGAQPPQPPPAEQR